MRGDITPQSSGHAPRRKRPGKTRAAAPPSALGLALLLAVAGAACGQAPGASADPARGAAEPAPSPAGLVSTAPERAVRPGVDVLLDDSLHLVSGKRVGLITNHTGVDARGIPTIDRLWNHPGVELVALYAPEHGIRGTVEAGERVDDSIDPQTGLPIHSLYGATQKPSPAMLDGIEVLLFDIQDIGTRYYTYIYTMSLAMEAAGEADISFVVLDRPNPLGGRLVQGNVLDPAFASFIGLHPLPMRHGLTPGELALLYRDAFGVDADVTVVPMDGWRREQLFPETDLPWIPPSPNMPDLQSALHYPGTCLFEGTLLSVGRGTEFAFQVVGAPWLDGEELARRMGAQGLPGVAFHAARFTPRQPGDGKFPDQELGGVRLEVTDPDLYDPTFTAVVLLTESRSLAGDRWQWRATHFDRLAGNSDLRTGIEAGVPPDRLTSDWQEQIEAFGELRQGVLLYP